MKENEKPVVINGILVPEKIMITETRESMDKNNAVNDTKLSPKFNELNAYDPFAIVKLDMTALNTELSKKLWGELGSKAFGGDTYSKPIEEPPRRLFRQP